MKKQFLEAGYTVVDTDSSENKLLAFLKEHYPNVIKDNEIDLNELKAIVGLPIDEKVNGYGLNFVEETSLAPNIPKILIRSCVLIKP